VSNRRSCGKTPWLLRFNYWGMKFKHMLGANMRLDECSTRELIQSAELAFWLNDVAWSNYLMEEAAIRIMEEHPPDVERLESEIEEDPEEDFASIKGEGRKINYDSDGLWGEGGWYGYEER
jgi:hypothetical protein